MTSISYTSVDEYIQSFPRDVQDKLQTVRKLLKETTPQIKESISYNMAAFTLNNQKLLFLAGWKYHLSLYPFSKEMAKEFPESTLFRTSGQGTIQFPYDQTLPLPLLRKIIEYRKKELS